MTTTYDPTLRRLGYLVRTGPGSPLLAMLDRAGSRTRPLNRLYPLDGHWVGSCPLCSSEDTLYVEPGLTEWSATCCGTGGSILDLQAATGIVAERVIEAAKTVPPLLEG